MQHEEIGSFNDIQDIKYVKFGNEPIKMGFTSSTFLTSENKYNTRVYRFAVEVEGEAQTLSVTSIRLMLKLKEYDPLKGKIIEICRVGEGMETDYLVKPVTK